MPFIEIFSTAHEVARNVFSVIDRIPKIDPTNYNNGIYDKKINGNIEFKNISFQYPSRLNIHVREFIQ